MSQFQLTVRATRNTPVYDSSITPTRARLRRLRPRRPTDRSGVALSKRRTRDTTTSPADARLYRKKPWSNSKREECEADRSDKMMQAFYTDELTMSTRLSRPAIGNPGSPSKATKRTSMSYSAGSRQHYHIRRHRRRLRRRYVT